MKEMCLRGLVAFGLLLNQLSLGVDCEDPANRDSNLLIGKHILQRETQVTPQAMKNLSIKYTNMTISCL